MDNVDSTDVLSFSAVHKSDRAATYPKAGNVPPVEDFGKRGEVRIHLSLHLKGNLNPAHVDQNRVTLVDRIAHHCLNVLRQNRNRLHEGHFHSVSHVILESITVSMTLTDS